MIGTIISQFVSFEDNQLRRFLDVRVEASSDGVRGGSDHLRDFPGLHFECF